MELEVINTHVDILSLCIVYGDDRINFERVQRKSDTQQVLIKVYPDCRVQAFAPKNATNDEVLAAVQKRGRWIYKKLCVFREQQADITPRKYISGESHYYLGKQHVLKVIEASNGPQKVRLLRGKLEVVVRNNSPEKVNQLLSDWYRTRANEVFLRRITVLLGKTLWVTEAPLLRVQIMQTQWGSCSPTGRLTLNPHLVKTPIDCIDYVILHELCHIAEHNHSERFYRLMYQVMPEWEKTKGRLDRTASMVL